MVITLGSWIPTLKILEQLHAIFQEARLLQTTNTASIVDSVTLLNPTMKLRMLRHVIKLQFIVNTSMRARSIRQTLL